MRRVYCNCLGGAHELLQSACNNLVLQCKDWHGACWGVCLGWVCPGNSCFLSAPDHSCLLTKQCKVWLHQPEIRNRGKSSCRKSGSGHRRASTAPHAHRLPEEPCLLEQSSLEARLKQGSPRLTTPTRGDNGFAFPKHLFFSKAITLYESEN